jgi:hypothetical protein
MRKELLIIPLLAVLVSCEKQNSNQINILDTLSISNVPNATFDQMGWLVFTNSNSFKSTLALIASSDSVYEETFKNYLELFPGNLRPDQVDSIYLYYGYEEGQPIDQWENIFENFHPLRTHINLLQDNWLLSSSSQSDWSTYPDNFYNDDYFNSLVNKDGVVQIGNFVYFYLSDGRSAAIKRSDITSSNYSSILQMLNNNFSGVNYTYETCDSTVLVNEILGINDNSSLNTSKSASVITVFVPGVVIYCLWNVATWGYDSFSSPNEGTDCKFCSVEDTTIYNATGDKRWIMKSKFCGVIGIGQLSSARMSHFKYQSSGHWVKLRSNMRFYAYTPFRWRDTDCGAPIDVSHVLDKSRNNVKSVHKTSFPLTTYHSSKIKNGERVTDFYDNNNLLISLHNVW